MAEALDGWLESLALRCSPYTLRGLQSLVNRWVATWGSTPVHALTPEVLEAYFSHRAKVAKATSVNHEAVCLRWFLKKYCLPHGYITRDPMIYVERVPEPERRIRVLTPEEETTLLGQLSPEVAQFCVVAVETGLRLRTLLELDWAWIDLQRGWLVIPAEAMKRRRDYDAPLSLRSLEVLSTRAIQSRSTTAAGRVFSVSRRMVDYAWRKAARETGIHAHFHDLRKTFLTRLCRRGVRLEVAMRLSDHRDIATVLKVYREVGGDELLSALGR